MTATTVNSTANTANHDPLFSDKPAPRNRSLFGQILSIEIADVRFKKGIGKIPFNPQTDNPNDRRTAITFRLLCKTRDGSVYYKELDDVSYGKKWAKTRASLMKLGITTRDQILALRDRYAHIKLVPSGGKYQAKRDAADGSFKAGDMLDEMTWEFETFFDSEAEMEAKLAELRAKYENTSAPTPSIPSTPSDPTTAVATATIPTGLDGSKIVALQAILGTVNNDPKAFEERIKSMPFIATVDSPEFRYVMSQIPF